MEGLASHPNAGEAAADTDNASTTKNIFLFFLPPVRTAKCPGSGRQASPRPVLFAAGWAGWLDWVSGLAVLPGAGCLGWLAGLRAGRQASIGQLEDNV